MPFFTSGGDKEKLMILFALKNAAIPLSREQLTAIMAEQGLDNYISVAQHVIELEETACLASVPTFRIQTLVLTKRGEEVVSLFSGMLPKSVRDGITDFIDLNRDAFRLENNSQAETLARTDGDYTTSLALVENGEAFFEIRLRLPSARYTRIAEKQWSKLSKKLYLDTVLALTTEDENPSQDEAESGGGDPAGREEP